jgi:hypothetical protein
MVDVVMKMKFSINKYSQVFNTASLGYGGLEKFIIKDQYVDFSEEEYNLISLMLSFIQLAVHRHCVELMPDFGRLQSSGNLLNR